MEKLEEMKKPTKKEQEITDMFDSSGTSCDELCARDGGCQQCNENYYED
jgi:hypothetical protein